MTPMAPSFVMYDRGEDNGYGDANDNNSESKIVFTFDCNYPEHVNYIDFTVRIEKKTKPRHKNRKYYFGHWVIVESKKHRYKRHTQEGQMIEILSLGCLPPKKSEELAQHLFYESEIKPALPVDLAGEIGESSTSKYLPNLFKFYLDLHMRERLRLVEEVQTV